MLLRLFKYLLTWCGVGVSKARYEWINSGAFLASREWIELRYQVMGAAASAGAALRMAQSSMSIISSRAGRIRASPSRGRIFKSSAPSAIAARATAPTIGGGRLALPALG